MFLCTWDRICIFVIIVIFSLDVYIFHSGAVQKLGFKLLSGGYF